MTTMKLEDVRTGLRVMAKLQRESECDGAWFDEMAEAIDAHLAKGAQVPDAKSRTNYMCDEDGHPDVYCQGHMDGWNACREAMLSQRGEVEGGD